MKKRRHNNKLITFGAILVATGLILMLNSFPKITGFSVYSGLGSNLGSMFSIIFMLVGLLFMNLGLEDLLSFKGSEVVVSKKALERLKKDKFVRENKRRYVHEIDMIMSSDGKRPQEIIREFHLSPQGHGPARAPRVAWHYNAKEKRLYIDDLLYHERGNIYVDNWANLAEIGKITLGQYLAAGYVNLKETALA